MNKEPSKIKSLSIGALLGLAVSCIIYIMLSATKEEVTFDKKIDTYGINEINFDSNGNIYGKREGIDADVKCVEFDSSFPPYDILWLKDNKWLISEREKEVFSKNNIENLLVDCLPKLDKALERQQKINESWK